MKGYNSDKYLIVTICYTDYTDIAEMYSDDWTIKEAVEDLQNREDHIEYMEQGKEIAEILVQRTTKYTPREY